MCILRPYLTGYCRKRSALINPSKISDNYTQDWFYNQRQCILPTAVLWVPYVSWSEQRFIDLHSINQVMFVGAKCCELRRVVGRNSPTFQRCLLPLSSGREKINLTKKCCVSFAVKTECLDVTYINLCFKVLIIPVSKGSPLSYTRADGARS
jgi:hypothetical protein